MNLTAAEVYAALGVNGGFGRADLTTVFERVSTDTREDLAGSLFVALKGANFDGHAFLSKAIEKGALGVVYDHGEPPPGVFAFKVKDTLDALGQLGLAARRKLACKVGGITGSFGKTTTKEMAVRLLSSTGQKVLHTAGNLNNRVGMPKTLLGAVGDETAAVLELGISLKGEMSALSRSLNPDVALITGVGAAHTEGLGDLESVAAEKMKIAEGLGEGGILLLPHNDPLLKAAKIRGGTGITFATFGWEKGADYRGENLTRLSGGESSFTLCGRTLRVGLPGSHNASNALAASALAMAMGFKLPAGADPLADMKAPALRGEVRKTPWGANVYVDCYNSNPGAVAAALDTLADLAGDGAKIVVLGEMRELGELSQTCHQEIGRLVAKGGAKLLLALGKSAKPAVEAAMASGMDEKTAILCETHEEVAEKLKVSGKLGDWILIKGSRGIRLDIVADAITVSASESI